MENDYAEPGARADVGPHQLPQLLRNALRPATILRVTVGRGNRFTRHHTNEAPNAQIWFDLVWNAVLVPIVLTSRDEGGLPVWVFVGIAIAFAAWIATAGLSAFGAVRASQGTYWRYPIPFRFVPGSVCKNDPSDV